MNWFKSSRFFQSERPGLNASAVHDFDNVLDVLHMCLVTMYRILRGHTLVLALSDPMQAVEAEALGYNVDEDLNVEEQRALAQLRPAIEEVLRILYANQFINISIPRSRVGNDIVSTAVQWFGALNRLFPPTAGTELVLEFYQSGHAMLREAEAIRSAPNFPSNLTSWSAAPLTRLTGFSSNVVPIPRATSSFEFRRSTRKAKKRSTRKAKKSTKRSYRMRSTKRRSVKRSAKRRSRR